MNSKQINIIMYLVSVLITHEVAQNYVIQLLFGRELTMQRRITFTRSYIEFHFTKNYRLLCQRKN